MVESGACFSCGGGVSRERSHDTSKQSKSKVEYRARTRRDRRLERQRRSKYSCGVHHDPHALVRLGHVRVAEYINAMHVIVCDHVARLAAVAATTRPDGEMEATFSCGDDTRSVELCSSFRTYSYGSRRSSAF
jgi:hypothetical protein